jgi:hypothetical protein
VNWLEQSRLPPPAVCSRLRVWVPAVGGNEPPGGWRDAGITDPGRLLPVLGLGAGMCREREMWDPPGPREGGVLELLSMYRWGVGG